MNTRRMSLGSDDDAELVALAKQFEPLYATFWAALDRIDTLRPGDDPDAAHADFVQAYGTLQPTLMAISALPAHGELGERVKLQAWAHCRGYEGKGAEDLWGGQETLGASVLEDILRKHEITVRWRKKLLEPPASRTTRAPS